MRVDRAHVIAHAVSDEVNAAFPGVIDVIVHIEPAESGPAFVPTS
jgi:divalent metal cation (Fe/Co/Zn/Cd) transporter